MALCTVRSKVDHASLWKQMMIDVDGRLLGYSLSTHLREREREHATSVVLVAPIYSLIVYVEMRIPTTATRKLSYEIS